MSFSITHFMWGYQPHFRINQQCVSERVFRLIDERFEPEVFLVGILIDDRNDRYPACVEPEIDHWIQSQDFNNALDLAKHIRPSYPENSMMHSHPIAQERHDDNLTRRSISDAIFQIINKKNQDPSITYFVSHPAKIEGYLVCVVLGLQSTILEEYPSLLIDHIPLHECRNMDVTTSFIDAVVTIFLEKTSAELRLSNPGCGSSNLNAEEVLREASNKFLTDLAYRADQDCIDGWHGIFSACTNIAATDYEKAEGCGVIILARKGHQAIKPVVNFVTPTKFGITRASRKLLQLASNGFALHTDSANVFGLVKEFGYIQEQENLFKINFIGRHHWEVTHSDQVLMRVKYGQPYLPKPPFNIQKLRKDLPRLFGKMNVRQVERIVRLVSEAEKEQHGTMLLITKAAKKEAERLKSQGLPIAPKILTSELLANLTPIDGAVILNPKGTCYAVGSILDGMATAEGNPARGARYNSALRYVKSSKYPCLAVVVSEDGGIDFIPDLRPAINKSEIESAIDCLEKIASSDKPTSRKRYNETMEWLTKHSFYLLSRHCIKINELRRVIDDKLQSETPSAIRILRGDFCPHPDMRTDLYYEED